MESHEKVMANFLGKSWEPCNNVPYLCNSLLNGKGQDTGQTVNSEAMTCAAVKI